MKKNFDEAEIEITKFTITSVMTASEHEPDLGGGDEYDWDSLEF